MTFLLLIDSFMEENFCKEKKFIDFSFLKLMKCIAEFTRYRDKLVVIIRNLYLFALSRKLRKIFEF